MNKKILALITGGLVAAGAIGLGAASTSAGNGAPSGNHYNLNIIGVSNPKKTTMTDTQRRTIFVPLVGNCKIMLGEGAFTVVDGNCTDGTSTFQLPAPGTFGDSDYSVWVRELGQPGGSATMEVCYDDNMGYTWCDPDVVTLVRLKGKSSFSNVTNQLLYIDLEGGGRMALFDQAGYDYWWDYDNNGLRLVQMRFYEN
ncbi:MAG: hypothetical protein RJB61_1413 [Actinomycetota bacterium]|jgi:hypothetical protein